MGRTEERTPKAYSLRITDNALQNIDDITGYIAFIKHQPLNAITVGDKIFETIDRIGHNPPWHLGSVKRFPQKEKLTVKRFA